MISILTSARTLKKRLAFGWVFLCLLGLSLHAEEATTNAPLAKAAEPVATVSEKPAATSPTNRPPAPVVASEPMVKTNAPATNAPAEVSTPVAPLAVTSPTPGQGQLVVPDVKPAPLVVEKFSTLKEFQDQLALGRKQRREKSLDQAMLTLTKLFQSEAPVDLRRSALFEMALVAQDDKKLVKAQQIFSQYIHLYPNDESLPEILLRQGMIYRQMGVTTLAISKFYAVMSSALKLKLENIDYYKKLVLQAQVEIADTYYDEGKFQESADFFKRLLRANAADLNQPQVQFKLIRSLSFSPEMTELVAKAQGFLDKFPKEKEVPEVRFILASTLKKLNRNQDSMKQVLVLLKSQEENAKQNPEAWSYWQRRAGNEIANQLYKEGDYLNALQIYEGLAELDPSPAWQLPVWYQSALVYEQLQQWEKAKEMYGRITDRQKELTGDAATPSLVSLLDMAKWRKDYIGWMEKTKIADQAYLTKPMASTNAVTTQ